MTGDGLKRRDFLASGVTLAAAPFVNRHRYRFFESQQSTYSKRAVDLVTTTTVIDMLSPFKIGQSTWMQRPSDFSKADLQRFRDSGITVFHTAVGIGGVDALYERPPLPWAVERLPGPSP